MSAHYNPTLMVKNSPDETLYQTHGKEEETEELLEETTITSRM